MLNAVSVVPARQAAPCSSSNVMPHPDDGALSMLAATACAVCSSISENEVHIAQEVSLEAEPIDERRGGIVSLTTRPWRRQDEEPPHQRERGGMAEVHVRISPFAPTPHSTINRTTARKTREPQEGGVSSGVSWA